MVSSGPHELLGGTPMEVYHKQVVAGFLEMILRQMPKVAENPRRLVWSTFVVGWSNVCQDRWFWHEGNAMVNYINLYSARATQRLGGVVMDIGRMVLSDDITRLSLKLRTCGDGFHCSLPYTQDGLPCDKCIFKAAIYIHYLMTLMGRA